MSGNSLRVSIAALILSAAGFSFIALDEGYAPKAVPPVPGDVPTYGLGSTTHADGRPVKAGETITPPEAIQLAVRDISVKEAALKRCIPAEVKLTQGEYDAIVSLAYNVGAGAVCASSIPRKLAAGDYAAACATFLEFVCGPATAATRAKPGERCYSEKKPLRFIQGLSNRRQREYARCMGGQS